MMERINFTLSEAEKEQLERDAHEHYMNVSEYLRWLAEQERKKGEG